MIHSQYTYYPDRTEKRLVVAADPSSASFQQAQQVISAAARSERDQSRWVARVLQPDTRESFTLLFEPGSPVYDTDDAIVRFRPLVLPVQRLDHFLRNRDLQVLPMRPSQPSPSPSEVFWSTARALLSIEREMNMDEDPSNPWRYWRHCDIRPANLVWCVPARMPDMPDSPDDSPGMRAGVRVLDFGGAEVSDVPFEQMCFLRAVGLEDDQRSLCASCGPDFDARLALRYGKTAVDALLRGEEIGVRLRAIRDTVAQRRLERGGGDSDMSRGLPLDHDMYAIALVLLEIVLRLTTPDLPAAALARERRVVALLLGVVTDPVVDWDACLALLDADADALLDALQTQTQTQAQTQAPSNALQTLYQNTQVPRWLLCAADLTYTAFITVKMGPPLIAEVLAGIAAHSVLVLCMLAGKKALLAGEHVVQHTSHHHARESVQMLVQTYVRQTCLPPNAAPLDRLLLDFFVYTGSPTSVAYFWMADPRAGIRDAALDTLTSAMPLLGRAVDLDGFDVFTRP
jgi:hypothetical protein